ncbi:MAG TPA: NlpC/P60 family protein [Rectinema sp.]|nr:NlpC/P60 family protein [Rectinema sp.]
MPTSNLFTAQQYADLAKAQVGKQYILGQPIPYNKDNPTALDCSGLVIWLNNKSGAFIMGDDTAAGLYNRSKAVTGSPTVGDLVFLRNNPARSNGIGHMAVITAKLSNGDWRIIEARGRASGVVSTTLSYWKTRKYFTGVRRIPGFKLLPTTTEPGPVEPKPMITKFNVGEYNGEDTRFGGKSNDDGPVVVGMASSVNLLVEFSRIQRDAIRKARGGMDKWLVWTRDDGKSQTILFEKKKWAHTERTPVTFGPTSYHGAVIAVLKHRETGQKVQFASFHLPPTKLYKSVADAEKARKGYFAKLIGTLDKNLPTVIGGDSNTPTVMEWAKAAGFIVLNTGATTDSGKRLDYILGRSVVFGKSRTIKSGARSDHNAIATTVTVATSTT